MLYLFARLTVIFSYLFTGTIEYMPNSRNNSKNTILALIGSLQDLKCLIRLNIGTTHFITWLKLTYHKTTPQIYL